MQSRMKKVFLTIGVSLNLLIIFYYWWLTAQQYIFTNVAETFLSFGRITGLLAAFAALMQFLFMGRSPILESSFGLDRLAKIHKWNGYITITMILSHAAFIISAYAIQSKVNVIQQTINFFVQFPDIRNAQFALLLFCTVVGTSIYIVRKRLRYEFWYIIHLLTYTAIALAWGHQLYFGADFAVNEPFVMYWYALYIFVFGNLLFFRFIRPLYRTLKYGYYVKEIKPETKDVNSVYISGRNIDQLRVNAGQFFIIRFLTKALWWQPHPFSISRVPQENTIRLSIKELGDFTRLIKTVQPGTRMFIEGPYGIFTKHRLKGNKSLFIAGGIGITPIRTLVEATAKDGKDIMLLFSNKTKDDIVFQSEFDALAAQYKFPVIYYNAVEHGATEAEGRLNQDRLKSMVPDIVEREIFLCGPPGMMKGVRMMLKNLGVPEEHIYFEEFTL